MLLIVQFENCYHPVSFPNTEGQDVQNNIVASCFVWKLTVVSCFEGRTYSYLQVFESKMTSKMLGPKKGEVGSLGYYITGNFFVVWGRFSFAY
jgi:hypothetical protein